MRKVVGRAAGKNNPLAGLPKMVVELAELVGIKNPRQAEAFFAEVINETPRYTHGRAFSSLSKREGDAVARRIYADGRGKGLGYSTGETVPYGVYAGYLDDSNFFSGPFERLATVHLRALREDVEDSIDYHTDTDYLRALVDAGLVKKGRGAKIVSMDGDPNWGGVAMHVKGRSIDKVFYLLSPEGEQPLAKHNAELSRPWRV